MPYFACEKHGLHCLFLYSVRISERFRYPVLEGNGITLTSFSFTVLAATCFLVSCLIFTNRFLIFVPIKKPKQNNLKVIWLTCNYMACPSPLQLLNVCTTSALFRSSILLISPFSSWYFKYFWMLEWRTCDPANFENFSCLSIHWPVSLLKVSTLSVLLIVVILMILVEFEKESKSTKHFSLLGTNHW